MIHRQFTSSSRGGQEGGARSASNQVELSKQVVGHQPPGHGK